MAAVEYSLYIVRCGDGSLYTGIATDVERRVREHEDGKRGSRYLRGRGPLQLEFSEPLGSRGRAQRFECRVKKLEREQKEALIAGHSTLSDLVTE
ncbi:MAG: GIY-YIG nuclease family protein [Woeseiaceae bacterium]|nr:GIY-YIG nuclease family protein [Woeseiaceae bacterium]NIP20527.1 GIY-YIG nuclease family protein [Woeseiaceae bacterium]NIS89121.1 GIY-YIG nuclease family protein [Woeseiaceae bacterium]